MHNTYYREVNEDTIKKADWPLPLSVIPNAMGINLCSVSGMTWTKQKDGQLLSLTIHFQPAPPTA